MMEWTKEKYFYSTQSAHDVCQNLSRRFNNYYDNNQLKYFTSGTVNNLNVICTIEREQDPCSENNILFTLEADENSEFILQALSDIGLRKGGVISR